MDQSLESMNSEVIYFLPYAVSWMLKVFLSHSRLAEYSDLHFIYSNVKLIKYSFNDCTYKLIFHLLEVYVSLFLDRC